MIEDHAEPDFWALLKTMCDHDVEFVIIGGFAVSLHGYVRTTKDIDIVPAPDTENLTRLYNAVRSIDARPLGLDEFAPDELPPFTLESLVELQGNWLLETKHGRIDLMLYVEDLDGELTFAQLRERAETEEFEEVGHPVDFASAGDLISMKQRAGRDIDRIDITALRRAHGLEAD